MAEIVPYTVQYPVRFYSGGDTVSEAVYKHIQEFESLYGKLTELNANKANSTEIDSQLNDLKTDLEDQITNISLTPGPKGDKGNKGEKGAKGDSATLNIQSGSIYFATNNDINIGGAHEQTFSSSFSKVPLVLTSLRHGEDPDSVDISTYSHYGNDTNVEIIYVQKNKFVFMLDSWKNGNRYPPFYIDWVAIEL